MPQATLNIKTDQALMNQVKQLAGSFGISVTTFVNLSLRQSVSNRQLVVEEPLVPNAKTGKILKRAIKDIKAGRNLSPNFSNIEDAIRYLKLEV